MRDILVIAAHPDDEVLGCGGTIAQLAQEGHDVYIAILGEGITSRYKQRGQVDKTLIEALYARSRRVAELLGAKPPFMYDLPDNRFDTVPLLDVIKIVEELVERLRPQVIYTHHGGDLNIDHKITYDAVLTATRPMMGCPVKEIYAFEVPSSTEWAFETTFSPDTYVDIIDTLTRKTHAMQLYESEARPFPHPRSPQALQALATWRGSTIGVEAAEAFQTIRRLICFT